MKTITFFAAALLLATTGCGSDAAGPGGGPIGPVECARECSTDQVCSAGVCVYESTDSLLYVLSDVTIPTPEAGVVAGFNMDGLISNELDEGGCETSDFVSPTGASGIDNQVASVIAPLQGVFEDLLNGQNLDDLLGVALTNGFFQIGVLVEPQGDTFSLSVVALQPPGGPLPMGTVIAPGQEFEIITRITPTYDGFRANSSGVLDLTIEGLTAEVPDIEALGLELPFGIELPEEVYALEGVSIRVETIRLRLDISTRAPSVEAGIAVRLTDVEDAITAVDETGLFAMIGAGELADVVNAFLTPDLRLDGPGTNCSGISAGVSISVVEGAVAQ